MSRPAWSCCLLLSVALTSCHSGEPTATHRGTSAPPPSEAVAPVAPRPSWLDENPDGSGLAPTNHGPDEVVAMVDGEPLTMQNLVDNALEWWGDKTLDEMIFRALMDQYRKGIGIEITKEDYARRADAWLAMVDQGIIGSSDGKETLAALLAKKGETMEAYKAKLVADENFRRQLALELVVAYDLFVQERVEVQHILVETPEKAKEILDKLALKAEFARLAEDESLDMRSAQNGGRLAPIVLGMGPYGMEFDRAAFALSPGQVSQPLVDPRRGVHVIRCVAKTPARRATWADVKDDVWAAVMKAPPTEDDIAHWITRTRELARDKVEVRWRYGVEEPDK